MSESISNRVFLKDQQVNPRTMRAAERYSIGTRFGRVEVVSDVWTEKHQEKVSKIRLHCRVRCDCGNEFDTFCFNLHDDMECKKCVSLKVGERFTTHGWSRRRLWYRYSNMIERCYDQKNHAYRRYGGRGITVCNEWLEDYDAFETWALANGFSDELEIDRRNNDKGYSPENCRWVTTKVNCRNKSNNVLLTAFGETKTQAAWGEDSRCVVTRVAFQARIKKGWDVMDALLTPKRPSKRIYKKRSLASK